jgi:formylglycine-generating enzyme required for sulfatase activity
MRPLRTTRDAYVGLDDPTDDEWHAWHRAMRRERNAVLARSGFPDAAYDDPDAAWSDTAFRQLFLFVYDTAFYDRGRGRYRTPELVERWVAMFGRIDAVLLWHAYPRLGFDSRTQFDFYREMPGGLARLRSQVADALHSRGIRVFVDYNPWDAGSYEELADIVAGLDADGVMLDTMTEVPEALERAVNLRKRGVVFAPELRPREVDLRRLRQSWAQWSEVGDARTPTIYRHRWLVPRHRQFAIRRWDTSRKHDIVYSFFNGSGLILWDNVFGTWNPYSREDRRLIAETAAVFDRYQDLFVRGEWLPLVPSGVSGLDANRWEERPGGGGRAIVTLRNRTTEAVHYRVPSGAPPGLAYVAFWGDRHEPGAGEAVTVEPEGVQAIVLDHPESARDAVAHFQRLSRRAAVAVPDYEERTPRPRRLPAASTRGASVTENPGRMPFWSRGPKDKVRMHFGGRGPKRQTWRRASKNHETPERSARETPPAGEMIEMPAGEFAMRVRHERRECGCYPFGTSDAAMWGWLYKDTVTHEIRVILEPFAIRATAVTNADFVAFVHATGYRPADGEHFLKHIVRMPDGSLPRALPVEQAVLPVTFVSLDDARAYAASRGQRLPSEAEWQWAAEGAGRGSRYPWGNDERTFGHTIRPALDPSTATPQGVMGLSGNTWELTESEYTDGHTRFVMLRGGAFLPPGESEWLVPRGVRPNDSHAKYILLCDGLDRSETVSFRTVVDLVRSVRS